MRPGSWLVSVALHTVDFIAMGHARAASASAPSDRSEALLVDITSDPVLEQGEPLVAPARLPSGTFVPPPTHTHPYLVAPDHDAHPHDPSLVHVPFAVSRSRAPETVVAAPAALARFAVAVRSDDGRTSAASTFTRLASGPEPGSDDAPLPEQGVSLPARLASPMSPVYPAAARTQEVEADVVLAIVVTTSGTVAEARIVRPTGFGFDEEALRTVRAARFAPAQRDGRPVAVRKR